VTETATTATQFEDVAGDSSTAAPWLSNLSPECLAAVHAATAAAPPLTDRQRARLRMLFRANRDGA